MKHSAWLTAFAIAMSLACAEAPAQTQLPPRSETAAPGPAASPKVTVRAACGQDAQKFCADIQPGEKGLVRCLAARRTELSRSCGAFLQERRAQRAQQRQQGVPVGGPKRPSQTAPADSEPPADESLEKPQPPAAPRR